MSPMLTIQQVNNFVSIYWDRKKQYNVEIAINSLIQQFKTNVALPDFHTSQKLNTSILIAGKKEKTKTNQRLLVMISCASNISYSTQGCTIPCQIKKKKKKKVEYVQYNSILLEQD